MTKFNYINCLKPLLKVLAWQGSSRRIFESVPYDSRYIDLVDLKNIFVNLGYTCYSKKVKLSKLSRSFLPTLFINESKGLFWIIYERTDRDFLYIDCQTGEKSSISCQSRVAGTRYNFVKDYAPEVSSKPWRQLIWERFSEKLYWSLGLSLICSLIMLIIPWFMQFVIDHIMIPYTHSVGLYLLAGMGLGFFGWYVLSWARNQALSYLNSRVMSLISNNLLHQLLMISPEEFKDFSLNNYLLKLQRSDSEATLIPKKLVLIFLELPTVLLALIMMGVMVGWDLIIIPSLAVLASLGLLGVRYRKIAESVARTKLSTDISENFVQETTFNLQSIQSLNAGVRWIDHYRLYLSNMVDADRTLTNKLSRLVLFNWLNWGIAGLVMIGWATYQVATGNLTQGTLFALGILIWQVYSPLAQLLNYVQYLPALLDNIHELDQLMASSLETKPHAQAGDKTGGCLKVKGVDFRYPDQSEMALQNIQMEAEPGEIVAVIGQNASGKSTFVQLLMQMHKPLSGTITLDGIDINDVDPITYRQSIGYAPSVPQFFIGTIAQNLRLVQPEATDKEITDVLVQVGLLDAVQRLRDGIHTELRADYMEVYSSGFLQRLNLARALIRDSNILIFDEPTGSMDLKSDALFKETIKNLKRKKTVIIVTHRPSIMNLADRILVLNKGIMRLFGPRDHVLNILSRDAA